MSQGLAADSWGAEDLGEVELGGVGGAPLQISRTCRSGLASAWCLRQTFVRRNVYLGPRLCFRLEELQEGVSQILACGNGAFSHCWHLHSGFPPATRCLFDKRACAAQHVFQPAPQLFPSPPLPCHKTLNYLAGIIVSMPYASKQAGVANQWEKKSTCFFP